MKITFKKILYNFRNAIGALLVALKHPEVSIWSKIIIVLTIAYALSPVDIIPDFIPFVGYLDDAVILPFLFFLAIRSIPQPIFEECKLRATGAFKKISGFIMLGLLLVTLAWGIIAGILYAIVTLILRLITI